MYTELYTQRQHKNTFQKLGAEKPIWLISGVKSEVGNFRKSACVDICLSVSKVRNSIGVSNSASVHSVCNSSSVLTSVRFLFKLPVVARPNLCVSMETEYKQDKRNDRPRAGLH